MCGSDWPTGVRPVVVVMKWVAGILGKAALSDGYMVVVSLSK